MLLASFSVSLLFESFASPLPGITRETVPGGVVSVTCPSVVVATDFPSLVVATEITLVLPSVTSSIKPASLADIRALASFLSVPSIFTYSGLPNETSNFSAIRSVFFNCSSLQVTYLFVSSSFTSFDVDSLNIVEGLPPSSYTASREGRG